MDEEMFFDTSNSGQEKGVIPVAVSFILKAFKHYLLHICKSLMLSHVEFFSRTPTNLLACRPLVNCLNIRNHCMCQV